MVNGTNTKEGDTTERQLQELRRKFDAKLAAIRQQPLPESPSAKLDGHSE